MAAKAHPTWFAFCRWLTWVFFYKPLGGFRSVGSENIPATGPVIFAPIRLSHCDPPAVAAGCKRRMRFMAKAELFDHKFLGWLITSLGAFRVSRGENDMESIRVAMDLLDQGEAILIFPEGGRGDGKQMLPIARGVAMLAKRNNAKVIPVGLIGTFERLPRGASKPRRSFITVVYGEPFTYAEIATESSEKKNRELFSNELAKRIAGLCNDHGFPIKASSTLQDQSTEPIPESTPSA